MNTIDLGGHFVSGQGLGCMEARTKSDAQNARQLADVLRPIPSEG